MIKHDTSKKWALLLGAIGMFTVMSGCQLHNKSYSDVEKLPKETKSRYGNHSPYTVLGKRYSVLKSAENYKDTGLASWYGRKFHGKLTSNRETYNMYKMTAAHKTLPLPTFVRVTRVDTGASIIVRVNDRGPFHSNRIIDLSYAAAKKLGIVEQGTAKVKVEAVSSPLQSSVWKPSKATLPHPLAHPSPKGFTKTGDGPPAKSSKKQVTATAEARNPLPQGLWNLQAGAFSDQSKAINFRKTLRSMVAAPVNIKNDPPWHRVIIGPVNNKRHIEQLKSQIADVVPNPILVPTS